jgi:hypothetical protein
VRIHFLGDWHTAYLLLYGPRRLPKYETKKKEESAATADAAAEKKPEEKMETS